MEMWYSLGTAITQELSLLNRYDLVEIAFFVVIMLYWLHWLNTDKEKNLASCFFIYSLVAIGSYYAELTTISMVLIGGLPLIMVIFVTLHQKNLQKNFIAINRLSQQGTESLHALWLSELMSFAINTLYRQQDCLFIIERNTNLSLLLTCSCIIQAFLSKEFLELLTGPETNSIYNFWITKTGTLIGINTTLNYPIEQELLTEEVHHLPTWQQEALFITKKSDAVIVKGSFSKKTFTIILEGMCIENLSSQQTMAFLNRCINSSSNHERLAYAPTSQQRPPDQPNHI